MQKISKEVEIFFYRFDSRLYMLCFRFCAGLTVNCFHLRSFGTSIRIWSISKGARSSDSSSLSAN